MPSDTSVPDAFIAARNALSAARNANWINEFQWRKAITELRSVMDGAAIGRVSAADAITYFDSITLKYSVKEEKV